MLRLVLIVVSAYSLCGGVQFALGQVEVKESVVLADGEELKDYPLTFSSTDGEGYVGKQCLAGVSVENKGTLPVALPLFTIPVGAVRLITVSATNEAGEEQCSYPENAEEFGPGESGVIPVLVIPPKRRLYLYTWFRPYEEGSYTIKGIFQNSTTSLSRLVLREVDPGAYIGDVQPRPIANVWRGRVEFSGVARIHAAPESANRDDRNKREDLRQAGIGEGYLWDCHFDTIDLQKIVTSSPFAAERLAAISTLSDFGTSTPWMLSQRCSTTHRSQILQVLLYRGHVKHYMILLFTVQDIAPSTLSCRWPPKTGFLPMAGSCALCC